MNEYNFQEVEKRILSFWEREKIFKFNKKYKKVYSIDTPPPTLSGKMHIGHAFSYSQQDFIARFHRMREGSVFYPFGTDDNGLPTERLVEKLNNVKSKEMSRTEFIKLCSKTLKEITSDFINDWKKLGISCDYDIYYSTIDENSRKISQKSFIDLYKKNLIYKKEFPSLWCPECQTSIAQAELEDKETPSLFVTLKFKSEKEDLLIATTRPELLGSCVAVFVNPNDKRYKSLIGKKAKVPLFNFEVPILEDESANPEKGTGVLMVCSYGDKYDIECINKHKLNPKLIINKNGTLNIENYKGLKIKEARKKIIEDLENVGLITERKDIFHIVNTHDKCGTEIEFINIEQWFIKILDIKNKLIENAKKVGWFPEHMFKRYENWVKGLEWDWSISRERHFGIPIPVWFCKECNEVIIPDEKELPIDPLETDKKCYKCNQKALPEEKVLDTWATSSLTPKIALSLIENKIKIPYSLRPQSHDIIRTWAFYTIARSFYEKRKIPWNNIMISGFVTLEGKKMSKSKGNVINPEIIFEKYGADSLRFWAAGSKLGEDLDYQEKDLISGKKFMTKIWNASKFVFTNIKKNKKPIKLQRIDKLFLDKLYNLTKNCTESFENYEYSRAKLNIEKFFWSLFCDNYLEIIKKRIYNNKKGKDSAEYTLYTSLLAVLKILAPIMPFITEEIYQTHFKKYEKEKSIHLCSWPKQKKLMEKNEIDIFLNLVGRIRQEKSNNKKSMNSEIILTITKNERSAIKQILEDLKDVSNAIEIKEGDFKVEFV